jgi:hypothetical protein
VQTFFEQFWVAKMLIDLLFGVAPAPAVRATEHGLI